MVHAWEADLRWVHLSTYNDVVALVIFDYISV